MNKYLKGALLFVAGALSGSIPTYIVCKKMSDKKIGIEVTNQVKLAREENETLRKELMKKNESMKEELARLYDAAKNKDKETSVLLQDENVEYVGVVDKKSKKDLKKMSEEEGYKSSEEKGKNKMPKKGKNKKLENAVDDEDISYSSNANSNPYVISPEEFGQGDGANYNIIALTYYSKNDIIVKTDTNEIIKDYGNYIVSDIADHFGEYIGNEVYVRNDVLKTDYDITLNDEDEISED